MASSRIADDDDLPRIKRVRQQRAVGGKGVLLLRRMRMFRGQPVIWRVEAKLEVMREHFREAMGNRGVKRVAAPVQI